MNGERWTLTIEHYYWRKENFTSASSDPGR